MDPETQWVLSGKPTLKSPPEKATPNIIQFFFRAKYLKLLNLQICTFLDMSLIWTASRKLAKAPKTIRLAFLKKPGFNPKTQHLIKPPGWAFSKNPGFQHSDEVIMTLDCEVDTCVALNDSDTTVVPLGP